MFILTQYFKVLLSKAAAKNDNNDNIPTYKGNAELLLGGLPPETVRKFND